MKNNSNQTNRTGLTPAVKLAILGVIVGIVVLFIASAKGTKFILTASPLIFIALVLVLSTASVSTTASKLYKFYETQTPILKFVPCLCELTLMDVKFRNIGLILYAVTAALLGITFLPYSVLSILGKDFAFNTPYIAMWGAIIVILIIQIIKGIGLTDCMKDINNEQKRLTEVEVGVTKFYAPLFFIPFVRVVGIYSINKPLGKMLDFQGLTAASTAQLEVTIEDADEEDD